MNSPDIAATAAARPAGCQAAELSVAELVGQVYEAAPAPERSRLIEQLLRPLGVLSLVAVAGGVFAKLRLRGGWQDFHVQLDDVRNIDAGHVVALVERAQEVCVEAVDGLAQLLMMSPVLSGSAAATLLVTLLVQRARQRTGDALAPGQPRQMSSRAVPAQPGTTTGFRTLER